MSLVIADNVLAAFVAAWPTTGTFAGVRLSAHAKQPGDTAASWGVVTVQEIREPQTESDGLAEQTWRVEIAVWTTANPPPTAAFGAALVLLYDGTTAAPGAGLTIDAEKIVSLVRPAASTLKRESERRAGVDVLAAGRAWTVTTNASQA